MGFRQIKKQPNMTGISSGSLATGSIPTSGLHRATYLRCLNSSGVALTRTQIEADIGDITVRINGEIILEASVDLLFDLQRYYGDKNGAGNVDGIVPIFWGLPYFKTDLERSVYDLGMANVRSFTVEAKIDGVAALSTIEILSEVENTSRILGAHRRITKFPRNFSSTGVQELSDLPKDDQNTGYIAMHVEESAGRIDQVTLKRNTTDIINELDAKLNQVLLEDSGRTPQAGYFHIDMARSNDIAGIIRMGVLDWRQEFTWNASAGAPGNYNLYIERIFGLKSV